MEVTGLGGIVLLVLGGLVVMFVLSYSAAWFAERYKLPDWFIASAIVVALLGLIGLAATTVEYKPDHGKGSGKGEQSGRAAKKD